MNYSLSIPADHARMILTALAEAPYKLASPVINNILMQTDAQDQAAMAAQQAIADAATVAEHQQKQAAASEAQAAV